MRLVGMAQMSKKGFKIANLQNVKPILPLSVKQSLLGPPEAVLDHALGDVHAVDVLVVDAHHESQGVPWNELNYS